MSNNHIVHLTSVHPPFDTRIFHKECGSLVNAGFNVTLIAPHSHAEIVNGINIIANPTAERRLKRMTKIAYNLYRMALEQEAAIYHFHDPELIPVGLLLLARRRKVVYDIHEDVPRSLFSHSRDYMPKYIKKPLSLLIECFENLAVRKFSALVTATNAICKRFQYLNKNLRVINNYPILNELIQTTSIPWIDRPISVAYIGAISIERGIKQMVETMEYLSKDLHVSLELAGAFSPIHIRDEISKLPGWKHVNELGFVNRNEVARILGQVKAGLVLFHPEPNHVESQPNKIFEYMSAGIPVIASDFPLWRELIKKNDCGILVDPLDTKAICEAIKYLFENPKEAEAMGKHGRSAVEKYYNWDIEKEKLLELYYRLVN